MTPNAILIEAQTLVDAGGWIFVSLLALAFGIAFALLSLWKATLLPDSPVLLPAEWRRLLHGRPGGTESEERLQSFLADFDRPDAAMEEIGHQLFARSRRRLPFAFILISTAPLIGLLGTVSGMFSTFRGMGGVSGTTRQTPIDVISDGISEALITTQTGLIIGVPTFVVCSWLRARHEELELRFHQLHSRLMQSPAN